MTTIAVRNGIVAFDSRVTDGSMICGDTIPKARISEKHGCVFAGCGSMTRTFMLFDRLERAARLPWDDQDWEAKDFIQDESAILAVFPDGRCYYLDACGYAMQEGPFHAVGSGSFAATAAMMMGASAPEAVAIACKVDAFSGLPVRFLDTRDIPVSKVVALKTRKFVKKAA